MNVGVNHVTLEQISIVILRSFPPLAVVIILVAFADVSAERQIPISVGIERNKFDGVEVICASRWITQIRVTFFVTHLFERRRLGGRSILSQDIGSGTRHCPNGEQQQSAKAWPDYEIAVHVRF
jgi:hypothetical protein